MKKELFMKNMLLVGSILLSAAAILSGCQTSQTSPITGNDAALKSHIKNVDGTNKTIGTLYLKPVSAGVLVYGQLSGLQPNQTVALHIHENGSCANNGKAAGGHFNPTNRPHGHPDAAMSHAGDLPNLTANAQGLASINYIKDAIRVSPSNGIVA